MRPGSHPRLPRAHGFTLIELMTAIAIMALLAVLSWRGLDGMVRAQEQTRSRADAHLTLQTTLAQWGADLDALLPLEHTSTLDWDGQVLRLTRRSSAYPDPGALVVAWTRRNVDGVDMWLRWQSPPLHTRTQWHQAWQSAAQWARNPGAEARKQEVALLPLQAWRLLYYRGGAWTNPQSSASNSGTNSNNSTNNPGTALPTRSSIPEGIRLELTLPPGQATAGLLTRDWFNPVSPRSVP